TILSGDIHTPGDSNDNSYHVVTGSGTGATAVLDGFTITAGNAAGFGGGMYNSLSSPTVSNCTFKANKAVSRGGGMGNRSSSPTVTNCIFSGNWAGAGGGMDNYDSSNASVVNCTFSGNTADDTGGGISNMTSNPTVTNCILWGNSAPTGPQIYDGLSSPTVTYCDVEGGYAGSGNISDDPCFVDADGPDHEYGTEDDNLRLLSASRCIDVGDNSAIPADTADLDGDGNTTEPIPYDLDWNPRIFGGIVDMGAYECQGWELTIWSTSGGSVSEPGEGVLEYGDGTVVPIVAEADPCYGFVEWTGTAVFAGKVADPCAAITTVTVDANYTLAANFDSHMLTVSSSSGGIVASPGEGVLLYPSDTVVAIDSGFRLYPYGQL
ncbi:MAG: right-handed parallel beta-helix repeat-containing protein, partial [Planctomycetota bacterium]